MPSPFPGVDPYLESQGYWPDFHSRFLTYWCDALADLLPEQYEARLDERVLIQEETRETYIEILHRPERSLVAVLELLSPSNKEEPGYSAYATKRNTVLNHDVHLVELDLLLCGRRPLLQKPLPPAAFCALVSHAEHRPDCHVYAWGLRDRLPVIPLPLRAPDPPLGMDLAALFTTTYDCGRYARSIDYSVLPTAVPAGPDRDWAAQVAQAGRG